MNDLRKCKQEHNILRDFRNRKKKSLDCSEILRERDEEDEYPLFKEEIERKRDEINAREHLESGFGILNRRGLFGLDEDKLRIWASDYDNLAGIIAVYHGKKQMEQERGRIEEDSLRWVFQNLSGTQTLCFLAGIGIAKMKGISDFYGLMGIPKNFGFRVRKREEFLEGSFVDFVKYHIDLGGKLCNFPFPFMPRDFSYKGGFFNLNALGRNAHMVEDILWRYEKEREFVFLNRDIMRTRYAFSRDIIWSFRKEHPGVAYVDSVIEFLKARDFEGK